MKPIKSNLITIDILRGFAASSVFLYHYSFGHTINKFFRVNIFGFINAMGANYAVPLFFMISGFCIHLSQLKQNEYLKTNKISFKVYFKRRFWRIYPCYVIILFFSCSVIAMNGNKISVGDFLTHLFLFQGFSVTYFNSINLVLWSISIEILFYLLYPLWYFIRKKFGLNISLVISLIVSISTSIIIIVFFDFSVYPVKYFILNIWVGWCFGAWLCEKIVIEKKNFVKSKIWWSIGLLLLILYMAFKSVPMLSIACYNISIILWAWAIVLSITVEKNIENSSNRYFNALIRLLVLIGISSYSLYMIHIPFMYLRNEIMNALNLNSVSKLYFGGFWLVATFFTAYLSYQLFEKPFLKYRSVKNG